MPFVTISKTVKVGCKPPVKPPVEGGPPPVVTPPIYLPIIPSHPIVIPPLPPEGEKPPGIWGPNDPRPTPPIYLPIGEVPGGPNEPTHPIYLPVHPAHPIVIPPTEPTEPGVPTHPIVIPPDGIKPLPPTPEHPIFFPVYPDNSLPGSQPHPDHELPGDQPRPDHGLPKPPEGEQPPLVIWGPSDPRPSLPIFIPVEPPSQPGKPTHPIYIPVYPDNSLPEVPVDPGFGNPDAEYPPNWYVPPPGAVVEHPQPQKRK